MKEEFILWVRKHPKIWKAVKKYSAYGTRVHDIFMSASHRQSLGGAK
jgi:hypothetical protein